MCVIVKAKELEDLVEAVRTENHRLYALQEQRKCGAPLSFTRRDQPPIYALSTAETPRWFKNLRKRSSNLTVTGLIGDV